MRADAPATRRSHQAASSTPPATHHPSMAAITGFDELEARRPERPAVAQPREVAQVGAGREGLLVAGEHRHPRRVVGVEGQERVVQPLGRLAVDGVAHVALVDADDDDTIGQLGFAHGGGP